MIINKSGIAIRMACSDLRVMGRATQGVKLINLKGNDEIASVAKVDKEEDVEGEYDEEGNLIVPEEGETPEASADGTDLAKEDADENK